MTNPIKVQRKSVTKSQCRNPVGSWWSRHIPNPTKPQRTEGLARFMNRCTVISAQIAKFE